MHNIIHKWGGIIALLFAGFFAGAYFAERNAVRDPAEPSSGPGRIVVAGMVLERPEHDLLRLVTDLRTVDIRREDRESLAIFYAMFADAMSGGQTQITRLSVVREVNRQAGILFLDGRLDGVYAGLPAAVETVLTETIGVTRTDGGFEDRAIDRTDCQRLATALRAVAWAIAAGK